jgi:hypothetical protein
MVYMYVWYGKNDVDERMTLTCSSPTHGPCTRLAYIQRETDRQRETETERDREETDRQRQTETDRDRYRDRD